MVSKNHIARGIEAVIDDAHTTQTSNESVHVWVPESDILTAVEQARKLNDGRVTYRPEIFPAGDQDWAALVL